MNILITGGAGYVGIPLVDLLLQDANNKVVVYDNLLHGGDALLPYFKRENFFFAIGHSTYQIFGGRQADSLLIIRLRE